MRLEFAARCLSAYVRVSPCSESLEEFGKKASLDRFGNVLVSGENKHEYNRFVDSTVNGFRFPVRAAKAAEHD
jgi:non-heme Fe2+,alpha-ketoglutarate-dependent halogenase